MKNNIRNLIMLHYYKIKILIILYNYPFYYISLTQSPPHRTHNFKQLSYRTDNKFTVSCKN